MRVLFGTVVMPKTKANKTRQNVPLAEEGIDRNKSLADWSKESTEILKLKCNSYVIVATGRRNLLAKRLFDHFHPERMEEDTADMNEIANRGHTDTADTIEIPNRGHTVVQNGNGSMATNDLMLARMDALTSMVCSLKNKVDEQGVRLASTNENGQSVGASNAVPSYGYVNPAFLQMRNANSNPAFGESGTGPFGAVNTSVGDPAFSTSANISSFPALSETGMTSTSTCVSASATLAQQAQNIARYDKTPASSAASAKKGNNSITYGDIVVDNPFLLPPVKGPIEKKLENGDFLDFEDLMPTQTTSTNSNELYLMTENNSDSNALGTPLMMKTRDSKGKVSNLANWMFAWNRFMEGTLSFKPQLVHDLFMYQKNFVRLANKHKFEACYEYDKQFRLTMASQRSRHPDTRTVRWDTTSIELSHANLQQDTLLPACFSCRAIGHMAPNCPYKRPGASNVSAANFSVYQPRHHQEQFRNAPQRWPNNQTGFNNDQHRQQKQFYDNSFNNNANNSNIRSGGQRPCGRFNSGNLCNKPPCNRPHICYQCGQGHPAVKCNRTNTSFRPQF